MSDLEKTPLPEHHEHNDKNGNLSLSNSATDDAILSEFTKEEERRIIHRIDRRLVLVVGLIYCISLMDRTNLSSAVIAGMYKELSLQVGTRYSVITLVFFTTYVVFQFPSTIVIKKLGPRNHLSAITLLWGICMIGMGFVKNWSSLAALRVVLGILEAGFFPGAVYLLSTWYVRYELQKRYAVFYVIGSLASACAGILAFGLMQMDGIAGYAGWRWIFIIEGIITCVIAVFGYIFLVNFPDDPKGNWGFLTPRELKFILARVNVDRGDAVAEKFAWKKFLRPALEIKIWGFAWLFGMTTTVSYALAYFLPIILNDGMGFSVGASQCLVAPPYAFAAIIMYGCGVVGDKYHVRGPLVIFNAVLAIVGLAVMGFVENTGARYFGVFLACAGANSNVPTVMAYQANNIRGHWKRAFCSATLVGAGGIGGIIGSLVFRSQDKPTYHPGLYATIVSQVIIVIVVLAMTVAFRRANRRADSGQGVIEGAVERGFRYTL